MIKIWDNYRIPGRARLVYVLIFANFLAHWVSLQHGGIFVEAGAVIPAEWFADSSGSPAGRAPILVTVFWSLFLHGSWGHLFWNMVFLLIFGRNLEAKLKSWRFLVLYLSCGAGGTVAQVLAESHPQALIIGASGAISGLMGAYFVWFHDHMLRVRIGLKASNIREFEFPIWMAISLWLMPTLINAFLPLPGVDSRIAYMAHVGGFAWGFMVAKQPFSRKGAGLRVVKGGKAGQGPFVND